jgi:hypothetical protein
MSKLLSENFRERAEGIRVIAEDVKVIAVRRAMLDAAERWERLAHQWEGWTALDSAPAGRALMSVPSASLRAGRSGGHQTIAG